MATCESYKAPEYLLAGRNENKFLPATTFHRVFSYPAIDYIVHNIILSNPHRSQEQKTERTEDNSLIFKETNINIKLEIHLIRVLILNLSPPLTDLSWNDFGHETL